MCVNELLECPRLKAYRLVIEDIVAIARLPEDKERYELDTIDGHWYVRATHGHSLQEVSTENLLRKQFTPEMASRLVRVYHAAKQIQCKAAAGHR